MWLQHLDKFSPEKQLEHLTQLCIGLDNDDSKYIKGNVLFGLKNYLETKIAFEHRAMALTALIILGKKISSVKETTPKNYYDQFYTVTAFLAAYKPSLQLALHALVMKTRGDFVNYKRIQDDLQLITVAGKQTTLSRAERTLCVHALYDPVNLNHQLKKVIVAFQTEDNNWEEKKQAFKFIKTVANKLDHNALQEIFKNLSHLSYKTIIAIAPKLDEEQAQKIFLTLEKKLLTIQEKTIFWWWDCVHMLPVLNAISEKISEEKIKEMLEKLLVLLCKEKIKDYQEKTLSRDLTSIAKKVDVKLMFLLIAMVENQQQAIVKSNALLVISLLWDVINPAVIDAIMEQYVLQWLKSDETNYKLTALNIITHAGRKFSKTHAQAVAAILSNLNNATPYNLCAKSFVMASSAIVDKLPPEKARKMFITFDTQFSYKPSNGLLNFAINAWGQLTTRQQYFTISMLNDYAKKGLTQEAIYYVNAIKTKIDNELIIADILLLIAKLLQTSDMDMTLNESKSLSAAKKVALQVFATLGKDLPKEEVHDCFSLLYRIIETSKDSEEIDFAMQAIVSVQHKLTNKQLFLLFHSLNEHTKSALSRLIPYLLSVCIRSNDEFEFFILELLAPLNSSNSIDQENIIGSIKIISAIWNSLSNKWKDATFTMLCKSLNDKRHPEIQKAAAMAIAFTHPFYLRSYIPKSSANIKLTSMPLTTPPLSFIEQLKIIKDSELPNKQQRIEDITALFCTYKAKTMTERNELILELNLTSLRSQPTSTPLFWQPMRTDKCDAYEWSSHVVHSYLDKDAKISMSIAPA